MKDIPHHGKLKHIIQTEDYYILHKTITIPSETPGLEVDCYEYINAEVVDEEHGMIYYQNSINYEPTILSCIEGSAVNTKDFGFFVTIDELLNELNMTDLIQDSYTLEELRSLQNLLSNNSSLILNR